MLRPLLHPRGLLTLAALLTAGLAAAWTTTAHEAHGASAGGLRHAITKRKGQERSLASAAAQLRRLERAMPREVTIIDGRLADAQAQYAAAQARLVGTQGELATQQRRVERLRGRLTE